MSELVWTDIPADESAEAQLPVVPPNPEVPEPPPVPVASPEPVLPENEETSPITATEDDIPTAVLQELVKKPEQSSRLVLVKGATERKSLQMGEPPRLVASFYPPADAVTFRGRVSVFATIGKEGKVIKTKMAVTSGKADVDQLAMAAAQRWTFKPALDQYGEPMECTKIISIPFNVPHKK